MTGEPVAANLPLACYWWGCTDEATAQIALRKQGSRWCLSDPYCEAHQREYRSGGALRVIVFDSEEVLPL